MDDRTSRTILVAGAGIAGLTAALAFARRGFKVELFERTKNFEDFGAGIQLSPNATRILQQLGVLDGLGGRAVAPEAIVLKDGASLRELARVPLGKAAEARWGAPYLVTHRAELHRTLVECVSMHPQIRLRAGSAARSQAAKPASAAMAMAAPIVPLMVVLPRFILKGCA